MPDGAGTPPNPAGLKRDNPGLGETKRDELCRRDVARLSGFRDYLLGIHLRALKDSREPLSSGLADGPILRGGVRSIKPLADGADVEARDRLVGSSPLELADRLGLDEVMDILVHAGADPGAR